MIPCEFEKKHAMFFFSFSVFVLLRGIHEFSFHVSDDGVTWRELFEDSIPLDDREDQVCITFANVHIFLALNEWFTRFELSIGVYIFSNTGCSSNFLRYALFVAKSIIFHSASIFTGSST